MNAADYSPSPAIVTADAPTAAEHRTMVVYRFDDGSTYFLYRLTGIATRTVRHADGGFVGWIYPDPLTPGYWIAEHVRGQGAVVGRTIDGLRYVATEDRC